jgi:glutaredoxin
MKSVQPVLYTKIGCPWCAEAREVLGRCGIGYTERVVTTDASSYAEMLRLSGQTKAPVLDWSGEVLADFGAVELEAFLVGRATGALPAGAAA